jgi:hypothetical protein
MTTATKSLLTRNNTIRANHPVRELFAGRTTGSDQGCYYGTKSHAINAFDGELQGFDLCLDRDDLSDFYGDEGRKIIAVHNEFHALVGWAVLSWYRMPSGRYEFTGYLA